jgi:hypothetical protein
MEKPRELLKDKHFLGYAIMIETLNSIIPKTSTNMFLVPYGIDKNETALSIT